MCFFETDAIAGFDSRISNIETKFQYVEIKAYDNWSGNMSENSVINKYFDLPDGISNIKKIDFYFIDTPYVEVSPYEKYTSSNPVAKDTISLTPGSSAKIIQARCNWIIGVAEDGRPYMFTGCVYNSAYCYWNISITFYM